MSRFLKHKSIVVIILCVIASGGIYKLIRHEIKKNYGTVHESCIKIPENIKKRSAYLINKERTEKGYEIGTDGRAVVSLRFDDYQTIFNHQIYPMLIKRGLPASMVLISRFNTAQRWGKGTTWNDVKKWNENGIEIWCHGTDHKDYDKAGYKGLYEQVVTSKHEIQSHNIKVLGFAQPGTEATTKYIPYNGLTKPSDFNSQAGILLMQNYGLVESSAYAPERPLPIHNFYGLNHFTVSDGSGESLADSKKEIDNAIKDKAGVELMCHSGNLGKPGNITLNQFSELLDYIKEKWDDGSIEVLTPSGLCFANPKSNHRLEILNRKSIVGTTSLTINDLDKKHVQGEQFVFEGSYKSLNGQPGLGSIQINYHNKIHTLGVNHKIKSNALWKMERFVFGIPVNTKNIKIDFNDLKHTTSWKDITIKII